MTITTLLGLQAVQACGYHPLLETGLGILELLVHQLHDVGIQGPIQLEVFRGTDLVGLGQPRMSDIAWVFFGGGAPLFPPLRCYGIKVRGSNGGAVLRSQG